MARKSKATSLTGRDGYIMGQALVYAIAHIQSLPEEKQEFSNMCDMCTIALKSNFSAFLPAHIQSVYAHTGVKVDLWPMGEPTDAGEVEQRSSLEMSFKLYRDGWVKFIADQKGISEEAATAEIEKMREAA